MTWTKKRYGRDYVRYDLHHGTEHRARIQYHPTHPHEGYALTSFHPDLIQIHGCFGTERQQIFFATLEAAQAVAEALAALPESETTTIGG